MQQHTENVTPPDSIIDGIHAWKSWDPLWPNSPKGMLLSDEISRFCQRKLLIASGFDESKLRPAAYTLTIGPKYVDSDGKHGVLTPETPSFDIKPNSIVFVSVAEKLNLPYYVAARFNLRVKWVYKGILLGTGPQVEPGFNGYLSCPLYNLTNRTHKVVLGQDFATIDFERTTPFLPVLPTAVRASTTYDGKLDHYRNGNKHFVLFPQKELQPLGHYPEDYTIVSSLVELRKEVRMWRNIGMGVVISFFALTLTLLGLQTNVLREVLALSREAAQTKQQIGNIQSYIDTEKANGKQKVVPATGSVPDARPKRP